MRQLFKSKKGIVGIEAAIVLIAFIIIAAALSYVVINMGFYITQKTKETMNAGLEESLNALQLDGLVTGFTSDNASKLEYIIIPVKISAGGAAVDLSNNSLVISVYLKDTTLFNVHRGAVATNKTTWEELKSVLNLGENEAKFAIYGNNNTVLESKEKAFLVIHLGSRNLVGENEIIKIEVRIAKGAALTVERTVPPGLIPNSFVSLG